MKPRPAARVGDPVQAIDTPTLVLDLDVFERNLARMTQAMAGHSIRLRPHAKSHKCVEIARRQIAAGAVGICCQKVSEAAPFVAAGISDVLITNQIVGERKLEALVGLSRQARIGVLVDDPVQLELLAGAVARHGGQLDVYVEIDVGSKRCGTDAAGAVHLAVAIQRHDRLRFAGLHAYQGKAQHLRTVAERDAAIATATLTASRVREAIIREGIQVPIITGAGTGTFTRERDSGVYDEIQPGSWVFMDTDYAANAWGAGEPLFEHSLFVLSTVISRPAPERAVVDAGLKALSVDSGMPSVWDRTDLRYERASDEHGVVALPEDARVVIGDRLFLVPGHCDPTVNLYDEFVCVRGGRVEAIWPVDARGALL